MRTDTSYELEKDLGPREENLEGVNPGLKSAVHGLLLLKLRTFLSPASILKIAGGALALGVIVYLWLGSSGDQDLGDWLETTFMGYLMPLICLTMGGGAIRNEIKEFTIEYLWTRPLKRSQLLIGSYVSTVAVCTLLGFVFGSTIFLVGALRGVNVGAGEYLSLMAATFALSAAYVGISQLLGVISGKFMVMGIVYGMVVEVGISQIPMNIRNLAVSHHLSQIYPGSASAAGGFLDSWVMGVLACLLIGGAAVAIGSVVFSNKQYSVGSGKE